MNASQQFRSALEKAGEVVECSWAVGIVEKKEGGKARPVVIFHDSTGGKFAHAFSFQDHDDLVRFRNCVNEAGLMALEKNDPKNRLILP